jgi:hypothetical protein
MSASNFRTHHTLARHQQRQELYQQRNPVHSVPGNHYDQHYCAPVGAGGYVVDEFGHMTEKYVGYDGRFVNANNCNQPTDQFVVRPMDSDGGTSATVPAAGSGHLTTHSWHGMQAASEKLHSLRHVASEPHSVGQRNIVVTQAQVPFI